MSKPKPIRSIVVVSDLHVGSALALCPAADDDPACPGHAVRDYLRSCWSSFWQWTWKVADPAESIVIVNGDLIEGKHHGAKQLVLNGLPLQAKACARVLAKHLADVPHVYIVEGTETHTQDDEEVVADMLKEEYALPVVKNGSSFIHSRLKLSVNGLVHSFAHHIGTTTRPWLEANQLGMTLAAERLEALNAGETPTDVMIRAHRHIGGFAKSTSGLAVTTSSWQFATRHVLKIKSEARPCVGGAVLSFKGKQHGEYPEVWLKEFRPAPDAAIVH